MGWGVKTFIRFFMSKFLKSSFSLDKLLYPLKALYSKDFYTFILTYMRGMGLVYLLLLSAVIATPASFKVADVLHYFKSLELYSLVAQIPPSYLNKNGILSPNDDNDSFKILYNSKGQPSIVYNTDNKALDGDALKAPIELNRTAIIMHAKGATQAIPYNSLFEVDSSFSPLSAAQSVDVAFSSGFTTIWSVVTIWFFSILTFNTFLTAVIGKFLFTILARMNLKFGSCLRFCAFANTIVAVFLLLQYYVNLPLTYTVVAMFPLVYVALVARDYRRKRMQLGNEAFTDYLRESALRSQHGKSTESNNNEQKNTDNHQGPGSFAP